MRPLGPTISSKARRSPGSRDARAESAVRVGCKGRDSGGGRAKGNHRTRHGGYHTTGNCSRKGKAKAPVRPSTELGAFPGCQSRRMSRSAPLRRDLLSQLVGNELNGRLIVGLEGRKLVGIQIELAVDFIASTDQDYQLRLDKG